MARIVWGDGREICSSTEESPIPQFPPIVVCRDCGCAFGMSGDQYPPDFSQLKKKGFNLEISEPNHQNVTFFTFVTNKSRPLDCKPGCIPAKVPCCCPWCRTKDRPGYHFRDCTCYLCLKKRDSCLNFYRNQLIAARNQGGSSQKCAISNEPKVLATFPKLGQLADEDEDFVPRNRTPLCTCHRFIPTNWCVKDPCPVRNDPPQVTSSKYCLKESSSSKGIQHAVYLEPDRLTEILTPSFSQRQWPVTCQPELGIIRSKEAKEPRKSRSKKLTSGNEVTTPHRICLPANANKIQKGKDSSRTKLL